MKKLVTAFRPSKTGKKAYAFWGGLGLLIGTAAKVFVPIGVLDDVATAVKTIVGVVN